MADDERERPDRPEYNVYRAGSGGSRKGRGKPKGSSGASGGPGKPPAKGSRSGRSRGEEPRGEGEPAYTLYRSSRNPLSKLKAAPAAFASRLRGDGDGREDGEPSRMPSRSPREQRPEGEKPTWRKVLRWAVIGGAVWFLISAVAFAVSAQIQKGKLDDAAADELGGNPLLAAFPSNILVIGTDARPEASGNPAAETRKKCIEQGASGSAPSADCQGFRADTLMVVRAGGGSFEKLSIPRDTLADIPGRGPQKINSAYATGGAALQIQTVENFLGIDIDHAVLLDFEGFADFIDAIGGVDVNVSTRVKSKIDGGSGQGGITLKLDRGEAHLDGDQALAYARTRTNLRNPGENDLDRARRQQEVLTAIKNRLTSPWRIPINFIRGPLIAWNAPKAMITDMGALTLPQLAIALAIGGDSGTQILGKQATATAAGNLVIPQSECEKALRKFLGEAPEDPPPCSPPG